MSILLAKPPRPVQEELNRLKNALSAQIPQKVDDNFLIATWNIRSFSSFTEEWNAGAEDSPKRDMRGLKAIIEILSRFDVIAIQEVKGNLKAMQTAADALPGNWGYLMTDVNGGAGGNNERLAFLYDRDRIQPSGLAAEIVIPEERDVEQENYRKQFARTPYAVSFQRGDASVILVTLHVIFGKREEDRVQELREIADWMYDWARKSNRIHENLITLGDFNIDRKGSGGYEEFVATGLSVPQVLHDLPRTIFDDPDNNKDDKFYDQIAWFKNKSKKSLINMELRDGGNFDFMPFVYSDTELSKRSISFRVSDHLPLWVEFGIGS